MGFVHLHTHSHYSLLDGLSKIDGLVAKAKACGMTSLALTDHGVMYGAVEFYQKCTKAGLKPIIGVEAYLAPNGRLNKRPKIDDLRYHVILLAQNETGYRNLMKLTSIAHLEGFYYKPRIDWEVLQQHAEGLIICSGCVQGEIPRAIINGADDSTIESLVRKYQTLVGPDHFFLELQHNPSLAEQQQVNAGLQTWAERLQVPLVVTNDTHYLEHADAEAQDILICLQTKKKKTDTDRLCLLDADLSFKSIEQVQADFAHVPEALQNTERIAEMCTLDLELGRIKLPYFAVPEQKTPEQYLEELCRQGITKRYGETPPATVAERLQYELGVIAKTGFASYFLIVADFVNWAKNNGIVVGPGRGSAAGSIVAYLTNITNIDPLRYDLLFERFLNPERISMPDIDLDFADTRRDEVIRYVEQKYGKDHVAQIITFGTMAARVAVRDVGRVLDLPYAYCDRIAKLIPMFSTLDEALEKEPDLKTLYDADPEAKQLIDMARRLEGVCRHTSTHACGVLITPEPLTEYVPIQYAATGDDTIVSQYSLHPVEDLGLLKMDFLGLKNLTILENTIGIIEKIHGQRYSLDNLPLDDQKTFQLLQRGATTGVFQLESAGMKRYLKQLKPSTLEDIIAMVSLYRPGPIEFIPDFIARKHGETTVQYLHPKLKPILDNTYGVAVYQEQILRIARDLAGFTLGEADVLRKAVGKKIASLLEEQREKFVNGCVQNGITLETARTIFDFIEPFARYGFNRAHAACYAMIAYQTAYFKANYPVEFMASLLTSDEGDLDRVAIELEECAQMGIEVLPPDINESYSTFTAVADSLGGSQPRIRFGLLAIKNFGEGVAKAIIHERKEGGKFTSFANFLERIDSKDLNKKSLESLAKSGALDALIERNAVLQNMEVILRFLREVHQGSSAQASLFGTSAALQPTLTLPTVPEASKKERMTWEKEHLGLYLSEHPVREYEKVFREHVVPCGKLAAARARGHEGVRVIGVVNTIKKVFTRSGEPMLFVKVEDQSGSAELIVFPKVLQATPGLWIEEAVIITEGRLSDKDGEMKVMVSRAAVVTPETAADLASEYAGPVAVNGYGNGNGYSNGNGNGWGNRSSAPAPAAAPKAPQKSPAPAPAARQSAEPPVLTPSGRRVIVTLQTPPNQALAEQMKAVAAAHQGEYPLELLVNLWGNWRHVQTTFRVAATAELQQQLEKVAGANTVRVDQA